VETRRQSHGQRVYHHPIDRTAGLTQLLGQVEAREEMVHHTLPRPHGVGEARA